MTPTLEATTDTQTTWNPLVHKGKPTNWRPFLAAEPWPRAVPLAPPLDPLLKGRARVGETRAVAVLQDETIPGLLSTAVERDPDGEWIRTDEETLTFGEVASQVAALAARLGEAGVGHGELVVGTARTTPAYVVWWVGLASPGGVSGPTQPRAPLRELTRLGDPVRPPAGR